jgi:hypothetical protein
MAGYSGTPLAKKLGIKAGATVFLSNPPVNYAKLVAPLPAGVNMTRRLTATTDLIHIFCAKRKDLERGLTPALGSMRPDAAIWVSWPKKSSGMSTDITEDTIRDVALPMGLVDIKVCAVDEVWSARHTPHPSRAVGRPRIRLSARWPSVGAPVRAVGAAAECDPEAGCEIGIVLHRAAAGRDVEISIGQGQVPLQPSIQLRPERQIERDSVIGRGVRRRVERQALGEADAVRQLMKEVLPGEPFGDVA